MQKTYLKKRTISYIELAVALALVAVVLLPVIWLFSTSLKSKLDSFSLPPKLFFFKATWANYASILNHPDFLLGLRNSIVVAVGTVIITSFFSITIGYTLARGQFKGKNFLGLWLILARMVPPMGFILPLYIIFRYFHMLDTYTALILTQMTITLPFGAWLMMGFFRQIPLEVEECGLIDGCSRLQVLTLISVPLAIPGIVTSSIFTFIYTWNEFLVALILTGSKTRTAPIFIQSFLSDSGLEWGMLAAAGSVVILPIVIFSLFAQKGLIRGLTSGSVKG
jgi:multiple sugar transport system permease protein